MRVVIWVLLIVFVLLLVGNMLSGDSSNKGSTYSTRGTASPIIACYRRGVAYFKEIDGGLNGWTQHSNLWAEMECWI